MNRPETNNPALEEGTEHVVPAASWGKKEEARQIALLDASVRLDNIYRVIDDIMLAVSEEDAAPLSRWDSTPCKSNLNSSFHTKLTQTYLDYADAVISGGQLHLDTAVGRLRVISHRVMTICGFYGRTPRTPRHRQLITAVQLRKQALAAALAIIRMKQAAKRARLSSPILKLIKSADAACYGIPLFAYGPELSEYRHRLR